MRRLATALGMTLALLAARPSLAGWNEFKHRFSLDYRRNIAWPEPFIYSDRQAVASPIEVMKCAGWRMHHTIDDQMFNSETHQLTRAGEMKVRWIGTQSPMQRRTVFVLRGPTEESTEARLQSVQDTIQRAFAGITPPQVVLTESVPFNGSGEYFDRVIRGFQESSPAPVLPAMQSTTGSN